MNLLSGLAVILDLLLELYLWIVFAAVLLSWIPLAPQHPTARKINYFLRRVTDPLFSFFRKYVPLSRYTAPFDITPLFAIVAIYFVRIVVVQSLKNGNPVAHLMQALFYILHVLLGVYLWIVLIAAIQAAMQCFFPRQPLAHMRIPLIGRLTAPVLDRLRTLFRSALHIHFQGCPQALDLAPFLLLVLVYLLMRYI
ncbi:hypothetical protein CSB45_01205 [candidate division KSB3 bacterium]|uniref:YggT family protein n=1 Tax=candidate division KSB3 bacterium TaxID=2044937 RepID=A0A2G6EAG8_9BACT|nr:MAG: hypothetical protein CSB45_01205 [candidate division KSB3 bacterium]PIE30784.1 MAG: hypothetical protein CSA57_02145 [candidate division KSB3 bacterium]